MLCAVLLPHFAAAATVTWDPDNDQMNNGGSGAWNTTVTNWDDDGASPDVAWTNGDNAIFGDLGANYTVNIGDGGVTVKDITVSSGTGKVSFQSVTDNLGLITVASGGATWNTGGRELEFVNNTANDTPLSIANGDTLTVQGGGTFDTGEKPNGANWTAAGATLDITDAMTLRGNTGTVGQFATVKLAAGSTFIHERNANQGYANDWILGGGNITFSNRWNNNGHIIVNGTISGTADELIVDMGSGSRVLYLTQTAAYSSTRTTIGEGFIQLNTDDALAVSELVLGGIASKNARLNMNGNDQTIKGLSIGIGNTREIQNTNANDSTLTIDVDAGKSFSYPANFANTTGAINLVKDGAGTQIINRTSIFSKFAGTVEVNDGVFQVSSPAFTGNANGTLASTTISGGTLGLNNVYAGAVNLTGGTLSPGDAVSATPVPVGTATLSNSLAITSGSLAFDLDGSDQTVGGSVNDLIDGVTDLTLGGTLDVTELTTGGFLSAMRGDMWRLINYSGTLSDNGLALGSVPALSSGLYFEVDTSTPGQVNLSVVPEPSSRLLASLALLPLVALRRRRK